MKSADTLIGVLARLRKNPALANDRTWMDSMEQAAKNSHGEGYTTITTPNAPDTWEIQTTFLGASTSSEKVPLEFNEPVELVGIYPSIVIVAGGGGGAVTPTLNDIVCKITRNDKRVHTIAKGSHTQTVTDDQSVTLGALSSTLPRLVAMRLEGDAKPRLDVQFRWKQPAGTYKDAIVSLAFFGRYLQAGYGE